MKNKQAKTIFTLGFIVVLMVFVFNSGVLPRSKCPQKAVVDQGDEDKGDETLGKIDFKSCNSDASCMIIKQDCCGCQMGGESTAINRQYEEEWKEEKLGDCQNVVCPAVYKCPENMSAKCIDGTCEVVS